MADNVRSHRSRDALARGEFDSAAPDASSDPLAELARLIGQSDAGADGGRQDRYKAERNDAEQVRCGRIRGAADGRPRGRSRSRLGGRGRLCRTGRSRSGPLRRAAASRRLLPGGFIAGSGLRGRATAGAAIFLRARRGLQWLPRGRRSERRLRSSFPTAVGTGARRPRAAVRRRAARASLPGPGRRARRRSGLRARRL